LLLLLLYLRPQRLPQAALATVGYRRRLPQLQQRQRHGVCHRCVFALVGAPARLPWRWRRRLCAMVAVAAMMVVDVDRR